MKYFYIPVVLLLSSIVLAHPDDMVDPWWDESTQFERSLPELIDDGWKIVGYAVNDGEGSISRDYVLQHPEIPGAWYCNWFSTVTTDGAKRISASCGSIRRSSEENE